MCGINGIAGYKGNPIKDIEAMNNCIIHRGPDAGGHFIDESRKIVMGHRRLSIIDLSEAGAQPMHSHDRRFVIVYNGEVYNSAMIKTQLVATSGDLLLRGTSDTEVLLESISRYGLKNTLIKCRGMWGIGLYDRESGDIMLARDRIGEKPLYYGICRGQFVWASDIRSISAIDGFDNEINREILAIYLKYGYIPAPYTIYKNIYKLIPGTILTISPPYQVPSNLAGHPDIYIHQNGFDISPYYDITQVAINGQSHLFCGSEDEAADELESRLKQAIKGQMLSDVSLGAFLSGGIDSTTVVSLMQQISNRPIKTFTIGFDENEFNEATFASSTADHLGTDHTEMYVSYNDVIDLLPCLSTAYGEPFADSSQLPTMLVSKMTKKHVTVALSGDAGDELFCGYNTYRDAKKGLNVIQSKLGFLKGSMRSLAGHLIKEVDQITIHGKGTYANKLHILNQVLNTESIEQYYRAMNDNQIVYGLTGKQFAYGDSSNTNYVKSSNEVYRDGLLHDPESNLMLMDMLQYLPDDILTKVDRAGMFYSLETRIPLLDADVVEFAWSLPQTYKMSAGITKKPLRNILYRYVPADLMNRPKKGFSVPISRWLKDGEMNIWAEDTLNTGKKSLSELLDVELFYDVWHDYIGGGDYSPLIWHVLMLCDWLNTKNKKFLID